MNGYEMTLLMQSKQRQNNFSIRGNRYGYKSDEFKKSITER